MGPHGDDSSRTSLIGHDPHVEAVQLEVGRERSSATVEQNAHVALPPCVVCSEDMNASPPEGCLLGA